MLANPTDCVLHAQVDLQHSTVLDFWQWAFSDLCDDDIKGWFAEWLVGNLLGLPMKRRISWANSDLITPGNLRIEVKSSAHWQSWKRVGEDGSEKVVEIVPEDAWNKIRFGGLVARDSVDRNVAAAALKSHLYVFAFQMERDPSRWNALDMNQWEFYLLPRRDLLRINIRSLSLRKLRSLTKALSAAELSEVGRSLVREMEAALQTPALS